MISIKAVCLAGCTLALPACLISQTFTDITESGGFDHHFEASNLMGGGVAWFDYDNDGFEDLYVTGGHNPDALYHNNGDGTFTNLIFESGFIDTSDKNTIGVVTGDIDNDGYREVFITTQNAGFAINHQPNFLFYNNGNGTFTEITESAGLTEAKWAHSALWTDINLDGFIDLYVGNYVESNSVIYDENNVPIGFDHECYIDDLYINNGDLTFTNATENYGALNDGCTLALAASDYDRDGDADLVVANDFGEWVTPNELYRNEYPEDTLENVAEESGISLPIYGMGVACGDYDEDLDLDYYFTNLGANYLMNQVSPGQFENHAVTAGTDDEISGNGLAVGWGTFFFDYNNDSYLDLYVSNGYIAAVPWLSNEFDQANKLYEGSEEIQFSAVDETVLPVNNYRSRGCSFADFNNDGALDLAVMSIYNQFSSGVDELVVYQNTPGDQHFVAFDLEGLVCNRDAYGAQMELHAGDRSFLRELRGGSSYCSQNTSRLHFGLGEITEVDSAAIYWPGGWVQQLDSIEVDAIHYVLQDTTTVVDEEPIDTTTTFVPVLDRKRILIVPNPARNAIQINGLESNCDVNISFFDAVGKEVWHVFSGNSDAVRRRTFSVPAHLMSGSYICVVRSRDGVRAIRVIINSE